jgi:hypothetical protein
MLNQIKTYFQRLWSKWFPKPELLPPPAVVIIPTPETCTDVCTDVPTLEEFEVAAIEPDVDIPGIPIDLEFIEPPAAESELRKKFEQLMTLLLARELREANAEHYDKTGSCNSHWPTTDSRVSKPVDSRAVKPHNSRAPRWSGEDET